MKRIALALLALAAWLQDPPAHAQEKPATRLLLAPDSELAIRLPAEEAVPFRGIASFDHAGGRTNSMLYQGGVAGLIVGVLTHSAIESGVQQREKDRIQEAADKVVDPYREVLKTYGWRELLQRAASEMKAGARRTLVDAAAKPDAVPLIETKSVFLFTPDEAAIVLEQEMLIFTAAATEPIYRNGIRVVSNPKEAADLREYWLRNNGENLRLTTAELLARALDLGVLEATGAFNAAAPHKTVRYPQGKEEKIERAELLQAACDRLLIRTLRQTLASVPAKKDTDCPAGKP